MRSNSLIEVKVFCGECGSHVREDQIVCRGCYGDLLSERNQLSKENKELAEEVNELDIRISELEEILENPSDRRSRDDIT